MEGSRRRRIERLGYPFLSWRTNGDRAPLRVIVVGDAVSVNWNGNLRTVERTPADGAKMRKGRGEMEEGAVTREMVVAQLQQRGAAERPPRALALDCTE